MKSLEEIIKVEHSLLTERREILEQLRDEKKELLLSLLENNVTSTRRIRALKEAVIGRTIQAEFDAETEVDDSDEDTGCFCGFCNEDEEEDVEEEEDDGLECICSFCKEEKEEEALSRKIFDSIDRGISQESLGEEEGDKCCGACCCDEEEPRSIPIQEG
jgi:hypothetical protein